MNSGPFVLSDAAERDLEDIWDWMFGYSEASAVMHQDKLFDCIVAIACFKRIGRLRPELLQDMRSLAEGKYTIFYEHFRGGIFVLRIMHGARGIGPVDFEWIERPE